MRRRRPRPVSLFGPNGAQQGLCYGEARPMPSVLCLERNRDQTLDVLANVRSGLLDGWRAGQRHNAKADNIRETIILGDYWDFTTVREISLEVALVLAAEYDRIRSCGGVVPRAVNLSDWDPMVAQTLRGIGFFEIAGVEREQKSVMATADWRILRFRSDDQADGSRVGELFNELGLRDFDPQLYDAIFEAIVNTRQHAYRNPDVLERPFVPRWWLTAFINPSAKRVVISVFDQGVSIPGTLGGWDKYRAYQRAFRRIFREDPDPSDTSRDGAALALAMSVGRSSTRLHHRGRGLPVIEAWPAAGFVDTEKRCFIKLEVGYGEASIQS